MLIYTTVSHVINGSLHQKVIVTYALDPHISVPKQIKKRQRTEKQNQNEDEKQNSKYK